MRLAKPVIEEQLGIIRRIVRQRKRRRAVETVDQHAADVIHRRVYRTTQPIRAALLEPVARRVEQRARDAAIVDRFEETEEAAAFVKFRIVRVIDNRRDLADDFAATPGQKRLNLAAGQERMRSIAQQRRL